MTKDFNQHKITSDIKRIKEKKRVRAEVAERMKIPKFGMCAGTARGTMEEGVIEKSKEEVKSNYYISPFPVMDYSDSLNLWDMVCDLNEKDRFEKLKKNFNKKK